MICLAVWIGRTANHNAFSPVHFNNTYGFLICSQYGYGDKSAQSVAFAIAEAGAMCKVGKALLLQNTSATINLECFDLYHHPCSHRLQGSLCMPLLCVCIQGSGANVQASAEAVAAAAAKVSCANKVCCSVQLECSQEAVTQLAVKKAANRRSKPRRLI